MVVESLLQLCPESRLTQSLGVGVIVAVSAYLLLRKRYNLPPGPTAWPLVGNLITLLRGQDHFFTTLHDWSQQYGPVMMLHLGFQKTVILSRIDVVSEALLKHQSDFAGRPQSFAISKFSDGYKDIIFANYGPTWKLHRKIASKAIRTYLTGDFLGRKISQSLKITTDLMRQETGPFDPYSYLSLVVYNIIAGVCFNKSSPSTKDDLFHLYVGSMDEFAENNSGIFLEDFIPPLRLFLTPAFRKMYAINRAVLANIREDLETHRSSLQSEQPRDLTDAILLAQKEAEKEEDSDLLAQITDTHMVQTISDVFFAGLDTSRQTLHWCLLVLCLNPDIQRKLQEEVDQVIGSDLQLDVSDRDSLPYTEAVLHEVMRLRPVAPMGVPHMTLCDTTVGGYDIPKGTTVMVNHHALHHDPDQWGDVNAFRPERFLDSSGKMAAKPVSWLPFSAGRRVCLGETLAKPELHLILAGILKAFTISLAPGDKTDMTPQKKGFANTAHKYKMVVVPRI